MKITLLRYNDDGESTLGLLYLNSRLHCYTLEDQHQDNKIAAETRIPEGTYKIGWQEVITPLTKKYRKRYDFFDKHIHIKDVPNFTGIYFHIGNTDADTAGCILLGNTALYKRDESAIFNSKNTYREFYAVIEHQLNMGEEITLDIKDITKPIKLM